MQAPRSGMMWRLVGRDSLIFFASACSLVVLQFAYRYLSVRELSVSDYGRVALLLSIFNVATVVGTYGIPATVSRLSARTGGRRADRELLRASSIAALGPTALAVLAMTIATYAVTHSAGDALVAAVGVPPMIWALLYAGFARGKGMIWASAAIQPANIVLQMLALGAFVASGAHVGIGVVLASFYVGNGAAYAAAYLARGRALRAAPDSEEEPDAEATPRRIISFSAWLALANFAVLMLAVLPRVSLVRSSYREVALFDLALLVYTIPQRLRSSFLIALLPIAARERKRGTKITVPGNRDLLLVTGAFLALDALLWSTHIVRVLLSHVGMSAYVGAEPLLLIILLAAPAELFFGLNSGLLQAFGESRRLSFVAVGVLAVATALSPLAIVLGAKYLAVVLVAAYWALHLLTRHLLSRNDVTEQSVLVPALASRLRRRVGGASGAPLAGAKHASLGDRAQTLVGELGELERLLTRMMFLVDGARTGDGAPLRTMLERARRMRSAAIVLGGPVAESGRDGLEQGGEHPSDVSREAA